MTHRLVYGHDETMVDWIERQLNIRLRSDARAIGIERDGKIVAAAGFDTFGTNDCFAYLCALPRVWWSGRRPFEILVPLAAFPFVQCGYRRVSALIETDNLPSRRLVERLGAKQEGVMRLAGRDGGDLVLYGLLREECGWLVK